MLKQPPSPTLAATVHQPPETNGGDRRRAVPHWRANAMTVVAEGELEIDAGTDVEHQRAGQIVNFLRPGPDERDQDVGPRAPGRPPPGAACAPPGRRRAGRDRQPGSPKVVAVHSFGDAAPDRLLQIAAGVAIIAVPNRFGLLFSLLVPMSPAVAWILSSGSTILAAACLRPLNEASRRRPEEEA